MSRKPRRTLEVVWGVLIGCSTLFAALLATSGQRPYPAWRDILMVLSGCFVLYAVVSWPFVHRTYRRIAVLKRGDDLVARWVVTPDEWQQFVLLERQLAQLPDWQFNKIDVHDIPVGRGVEVRVSRDALAVGDDYHILGDMVSQNVRGPVWNDTKPPTLQYHVYETDPDDTQVLRGLRFPVAAGSEKDARRLVQQ